ncbi:hypothetical protein PsYK624_109070 [Phanerochaete sordida]|uniref:Secreted protein n=1 Tax=Phanerochaete sordida TaxID=48140 RepID=A0A9P3LGN6_9APHY|nr:hypothetical protein PsYK624_109070 [Phanerochaete sordida]
MLLTLTILLAAYTATAVPTPVAVAAPATSTVVSCYADYCPNDSLKGEALFSMDWNPSTDIMLCEWRFPGQFISAGEYNITTGLLIEGDPTVCPPQGLMLCSTSTISAPLATAR